MVGSAFACAMMAVDFGNRRPDSGLGLLVLVVNVALEGSRCLLGCVLVTDLVGWLLQETVDR